MIDLSNWKLTLPIGDPDEIKPPKLASYEHEKFFYHGPDDSLVFRAPVDGVTTSGSKYPRCELREMDGSDETEWTLEMGGTLSATLKIDEAPRKDGKPGRIVIGQIHGEDDELVRLYWDNGALYFINDRAGEDDEETRFDFANVDGLEARAAIGAQFSYVIQAMGSQLAVEVIIGDDSFESVTRINDVWQEDSFYFKAGVYLGVNEDSGEGSGQATFRAIEVDHG